MEPRHIDLMDPETHAGNPWPTYTWLREEAPLYLDEANGVWAVSRYDDVVAVAKDPETFTSKEGNRPLLPPDASFIHQDGPPHVARRGLVNSRFSPKAVERMEAEIRSVVVELLDAVAAKGRCEFIEEVAAPLPMRIIADMTGIPREMHDQTRRWLDAFVKGGNGPAHVTEEVNDNFFAFAAYHDQLVNERKGCPRDDLLSTWMTSTTENAVYNEEMLLFEHTMLLVGGSETTRNAVAGGIEQLCRHPEQMAWLRDHPEGMPNAVEEIIRWVTPFVSMSRTTTRDVVMHGRTIPAGQWVIML